MLNTGISLQRLATKAGVGFTPKKLFSNGEAGVWYDPSDVEASLTWRRNLLEYTESFDNGVWTLAGTTVTTNAIIAPDGTTTADKVIADTVLRQHRVDQTSTSTAGVQTLSAYVKNAGYGYTWMRIGSVGAVVNIDNGVTGFVSSGVTVQSQDVGNGWRRVAITTSAGANEIARINMMPTSATADYSGDGTSGIYIWGAQLEEGSTATEYQPIRSTFDNAFKQAFPKHTLYQDERGLVPVTGLGQAVGEMLDKSQGLQFGDELVVNGTYDSNINGWTVPSGSASTISYSNGALSATRGNEGIAVSTLSTPVVAGKTYRLEFDVVSKSDTSGWVYIRLNSFFTDQNSTYGKSTGKKIYTFTATQGANDIEIFAGGVGVFSFVIDNVSLVEVKGSHATQSDSTKRPVFARHPERGRVNLLKYTEEFDNGAWTKNESTVTSNLIVAPDGTNTADKIVESNSNSNHYVQSNATLNGTALTGTCYIKAGERTFVRLRINGSSSSVRAWFNLSNGTVDSVDAGGTASIEDAGNGWYRCQLTEINNTTSGTGGLQVFLQTAGSFQTSYQGDGSSGVYVWGAQLEEANEATGYQKVVDDYDITESGYKSVYYLQFDGINDTMAVQPVTSTDAPISVFMGHDTEGNTGTTGYLFDIQDGRLVVSGAGYYHNAWVGASGVDPEAKGVTSIISDGTNADYRRDGLLETTGALPNISIQGAISIFSRMDYTTQFTNGNMYQLVVRGATSTDKEIDQAEEFVAIKTGLKSEVVGLATLDLNFGANTYTARNSNGSVL
jgi:hypothetical protein